MLLLALSDEKQPSAAAHTSLLKYIFSSVSFKVTKDQNKEFKGLMKREIASRRPWDKPVSQVLEEGHGGGGAFRDFP